MVEIKRATSPTGTPQHGGSGGGAGKAPTSVMPSPFDVPSAATVPRNYSSMDSGSPYSMRPLTLDGQLNEGIPFGSGLNKIEEEEREEAADGSMVVQKPGAALRLLADSLYERILHAAIAAVEAHAAADAKHGPRLKLENYSFLRLSLQGLPLGQTDVLNKYCSVAASSRNTALSNYVDQMLDNIKFDKVMRLGAPLSDQQSKPFSTNEVQQILVTAAAGLDKKLAIVKQRLQKHFGSSSPYLMDVVWERFETKCCRAWEDAIKLVNGQSNASSLGRVMTVVELKNLLQSTKVE